MNIRSMTGKSAEIAETMHRRKIDVCCIQETRWVVDNTPIPPVFWLSTAPPQPQYVLDLLSVPLQSASSSQVCTVSPLPALHPSALYTEMQLH